ncbi:MAG: serine/threonine protein kinase, partial [Myxococcales bacterium]|nr:serine/threonine protein kinase [Myxococcales bacterium]
CDAVQHAHSKGVIHRDLKPENVFVTRDHEGEEVLKLVDFGIAKIVDEEEVEEGKPLTRMGLVFGTPHYMSPEQAAGQSVDARTDIYALGVILFEMATGQVPFDGDTFMGILSKHMFEPPPRPTERLPSTHPLEPVILRALAKKPEDRYPSMDAVANDLRTLREGGEVADLSGSIRPPAGFAPLPPVATTTPPASAGLRGPLVFLGVLGVLLVAGVGVGLFLALRGDHTSVVAASLTEPMHATVTPEAVGGVAPTETHEPQVDEPQVPLEEPSRVEAGTVRIESAPTSAVVLVEGAVVGTTPVELPRPNEGELVVELRLRGYETRSISITPATGDEVVASLAESARRTKVRPRATETSPPPPPSTTMSRPRVTSEVVDPWAE